MFPVSETSARPPHTAADAVGFDRALARENIRRAAPQAAVFELSAKTGEGFASWLDYLHTLL